MVTRKVRMQKPKEKVTVLSKAKAADTVNNLLDRAKSEGVDAVAKGMSATEERALIDYGGEQDKVKKSSEAEVKIIKAILLAKARLGKTIKLAPAGSFSFKITGKAKTEVGTATDLARILKKLDKMNLFDELVSVKLGEVKKYLGEQILVDEKFITVDTDKYGSTSFKSLK